MAKKLLAAAAVLVFAVFVLAMPSASAAQRGADTVKVDGVRVKLIAIRRSGSSIVLQIGNHRHRLASGESARHTLVRAIVDPCADFRYERHAVVKNFTLCLA